MYIALTINHKISRYNSERGTLENQLKRNKLNSLLKAWPKGTVATSYWLSQQGIRFDLAARYKKSGWIESLGHGAFNRAGDTITWHGALYAMQTQLGLSTHPAGKTALTLLGKAHYLPLNDNEKVIFFSARGERLPTWFTTHEWDAEIHRVSSNLFPKELSIGFTKIKEGNFEYKVSSAERAILEFLYEVPQNESLEESKEIFEGLMTLQPDIVGKLLEQCSSVKAKRLFLVLAEMYSHPWVTEINMKTIDFGTGKRRLIPNGFLHPKYRITLPKSWQSQESDS